MTITKNKEIKILPIIQYQKIKTNNKEKYFTSIFNKEEFPKWEKIGNSLHLKRSDINYARIYDDNVYKNSRGYAVWVGTIDSSKIFSNTTSCLGSSTYDNFSTLEEAMHAAERWYEENY